MAISISISARSVGEASSLSAAASAARNSSATLSAAISVPTCFKFDKTLSYFVSSVYHFC
jgi:hypothetical protein